MDNVTFFNQFTNDMDEEFVSTVAEIEKLNKELKFETVPDGTYRVEINGMQLKTSKKGNKMIQVVFKILNTQYENSLTYAFIMLRNIQVSVDFLKSLDSGQPIKFENLEQYEKLIDDVLVCVKGWKEYDLLISTGSTGFRNYQIKKSYDKEQEELPFMD